MRKTVQAAGRGSRAANCDRTTGHPDPMSRAMGSPADTNRPLVLLVDDEPHITHILGRKLTKLGTEVVVARNGSEGLSIALARRPALIISDLQMPKMDGLEMAVALSEQASLREVPIIMISGRGFLLDDARLRKTNIIEVLEKPFSATAVTDLVMRTLSWTPGSEAAA